MQVMHVRFFEDLFQPEGRQSPRQGSQRHSIQLRSTLSLLLAISFCVAVLALAGSGWTQASISRYAMNEYGYILQDVVNLIDADVAAYRAYALQLGGASWVKRIAYMQGGEIDKSRVTRLDLYEYSQQMKQYRQATGVYAVGVIFAEKNLAVASGVNCDIRYLANNFMRVDGMTEEDWLKTCRRTANGAPVILPNRHMTSFFAQTDAMLMFFPIYTLNQVRSCAMFAVVRHQDFAAYFDGLLGRSEALQIAVSAQGEDTPFLTLGEPISGETAVIRRDSAELGLAFSLALPQVVVLAEVTNVRNALLLIVGGLWALLIIVGLLFSHRLFKPLRQLLNLVDGETPLRRDINEFDSLKRGIEELKQREDQLSAELAVRKVYLRNAELDYMLAGMQPEGEEQRRLSEFISEFDRFAHYRVCLALWRMVPPQGLPSAQSVEKLLEKEAAAEGEAAAFVLRRPNHHILILGYRETRSLENMITAMLEKWAGSYVAVGSETASLRQIRASFEDAQAAKDYRCVSDGFRVLRHDNVMKSIGYYLPQEQERLLTGYVCSGQGEQALAVFRQVYEENAAKRQTTQKGMQNLMTSVALSIVKLTADADAPDIPQATDDLEAMRAGVERYIASAADYFARRLKAMPNRMENILAYVNANLLDATLSLDMVANHFSVSASLISRLFTEQYGENFHAYVNRQRIRRATEVLANGNDDIAAVALQVGYTNDVTFRRMFKRFAGLTPSAYRANIHEM